MKGSCCLMVILPLVLAISTPRSEHYVSTGKEPHVQSAITPADDPIRHRFKRGLVDLAENLSNEFIEDLKTYVIIQGFNDTGFALQREMLQARFRDIETLAAPGIRCRQNLRIKLEFSRHMLKIMVDSAELLQFYKINNGMAQDLIRKLIHLNVRLLSFYNTQGVPDMSISYASRDLTQFALKLKFWQNLFMNLTDVPLSILLGFHFHFKQAEETIADLQQHFSAHEIQ
ncbi:hypothetical protein OXX80_002968 [Metschnikowia pulcherrima]